MSTTPNLADLIDHIIVKENHTFDKDFGPFPGAEGANLQLVAADTRINSAAVTCAVKRPTIDRIATETHVRASPRGI
jgi:phospholipase C